jgi:hypothetical protein
MPGSGWRWQTGPVDRRGEHLAISYGHMATEDPATFPMVARISAPLQHTFTVQFLLEPEDARTVEILEAVKKELDYYLLFIGQPNPWAYAKYHCSTASNSYSDVHWLYYPTGLNR